MTARPDRRRARAHARARTPFPASPQAALLALLLMLVTLAAAAAPVTIAVSLTPLSTPFFIAEERGMFAAEGVEVSLVDTFGGHRCLQRVLDGETLLGTTSDTPIMYRSFERDDFAVLATFVTSGNDVKLVARAGITRPEQLQGARIGTVKGSSSHYFLDTFLLVHGVDPGQVTTVPVQPETAVEALTSGAVDALAIWEPYAWLALQALADGATALDGPEIYTETFNLVALREQATAHSEEVAAVIRALARAIEFIHEHPAEAQAVTRERLGLEQRLVDWIWPDFDFDLSLSQSLVVTLEGEARWAMESGHLAADVDGVGREMPDYPRYFMPGPLERVQPRAVSLVH